MMKDVKKFLKIFNDAKEEIDAIHKKYFKEFLIRNQFNQTEMNKEIKAVYEKYALEAKRQGKI